MHDVLAARTPSGESGFLLDPTAWNISIKRRWAENSPQRSFIQDLPLLLALAGAKGLPRKLKRAFIFQIRLLQLTCLSNRHQSLFTWCVNIQTNNKHHNCCSFSLSSPLQESAEKRRWNWLKRVSFPSAFNFWCYHLRKFDLKFTLFSF